MTSLTHEQNTLISQAHMEGLNMTVIHLLNENNRLKQELGLAQKTIDDLRGKNLNLELLNDALKRK